MKQVAEELGVGYVVEGSVRKGGDRVRITAQLNDVATGSHIWAEHYDRRLADVFAVQDEITEAIVAAIEPQLYAAENFRAKRKHPDSMDAWDLVMRALSHYWRVTRQDNLVAQALLENKRLQGRLDTMMTGDGRRLPPFLRHDIERMIRHYEFICGQLAEVEADRKLPLTDETSSFPHRDKVRRLATLGSVGETTATVLVAEVFHRTFETRRHLASFIGLAPSPYASGEVSRDRGINKAGTKLARQTLVELAWFWLRYQPNSKLSLWWHERFGGMGMRGRKVGIVALLANWPSPCGAFSSKALYRKAQHSKPKTKGSIFESLPLKRQGGLATGKIDGFLQPRSSLVAARAFQAPAYVNTDCGAKAWAFDRIQVDALVCMVTAEARMVECESAS